jgi:hypothetical protein
MDADADLRAPGGAVTVALCGHWDHQPPCPVAPHNSRVNRVGSKVHVRVLFVADQDMETAIRQRIGSALASGHVQGPDGVVTRWQLESSRRSELLTDEIDHVDRLIHS